MNFSKEYGKLVEMIPSIETETEFSRLRDELKRGARVIALSGLTSISAKSYVLSNLQKEFGKTLVIITDSNRDLENWEGDLDFWSREPKVESRESRIENHPSAPVTGHCSLL
jgi:hypothetical protein